MMEDEKRFDVNAPETVADLDVSGVSVTEADVVAAFNLAEQTLLPDNVPAIDEESTGQNLTEDVADSAVESEIVIERNDYVKHFKLDFSLDDIPDVQGVCEAESDPALEMTEETEGDEQIPSEVQEIPEEALIVLPEEAELMEEAETEEDVQTTSSANGCLTRLIISVVVLLVSVALATVITTAIFDITGFNRNNKGADIYIPKGANTETVAAILKKEGMINSEFYFRMYVRVMKLDGKWREGSFKLQADMGFPTLINTMQAQPPRKTVMVTFPEGMKVPQMAELLEEKGVCSAEDFINAVRYGDFDYDFVRDIPTEADDPEYAYRAYRLEGYLFPDTYEFYVGSMGETVVDRMLQNFEAKISKSMLAQIKDNGWTLDQAVIMASMVQGEGDSVEVMNKVARVMHNRLKPTSGFTLFQFCSTRDYANYLLDLKWDSYDPEALKLAYNTYYREGLPIGAINNPGLDAFNAILYPSDDSTVKDCYYFATDYDTGTTYFSKDFEEHQAICKKYGIEDIG